MNVKTLTSTILGKMPEITKWQSDFLVILFSLHLELRGRHNLKNMSRYSHLNEKTFHDNYARDFDFAKFNTLLCQRYCSELKIVGFDPSFISKSGKQTPGAGYFWSGCAGHSKWGIEIGGFGVIDIINNIAMHLYAKQTLGHQEYNSLCEYYAALVVEKQEMIKRISQYLAVDAFFAKACFINKVSKVGIQVITRLRNDAALYYLYEGPHPKRKGRKTRYAGKFNPRALDMSYFTCCIKEADFSVFETSLYSKSMKRLFRIAVVHNYDENGNIKSHQIYASTDTNLSGSEIYCYYKSRFQIEFLYRDSKQFTGLEHCQSKDEQKLHFHFNTALTTVSLAKAIYHLEQPIQERKPFSMADIKTQYFNEHLFDKIIKGSGIKPETKKINQLKTTILNYGKIRA